jgi:hypothetical protein
MKKGNILLIAFLVVTTQLVSVSSYGIETDAQSNITGSATKSNSSLDASPLYGLEEAYTVPLNAYNESSLAPTAGQPRLLERIPTEALQPSQPFFGQPREIVEPGVRNETDVIVEQSEAQAMSNQTLNQELQDKPTVSFQNITNATSGATTATPSGATTATPSGATTATPSGATTATPSGATTATLSTDSPLVVSQITGFKGLDYRESGGYYPPDATLGVGPNHVIEMVNLQGAMWTKQGDPINTFALDQFFVTGADRTADPRVFYDPGSNRWLAALMDISTNSIHVAVSASEDPTGDWFVYDFPFSNCPDQPSIGVSQDKFVVSVNTFANLCTGGFTGAQFTVADKGDMLNGTMPRFVQSNPDTLMFSLHVAETQDPPSATDIEMVSVDNGGAGFATIITLDGQVPNVSASDDFITIQPTNVPPKAIQPDTIRRLETNDARVLDAEEYREKLWFSFNDACIPDGDTQVRSCLRLIEVDTNRTAPDAVLNDFNVAVTDSYLFFPALSVDNDGNLYVVFGTSSSTIYPSLLVSHRLANDSPNSVQQPVVLQPGRGADFSGRYGDYFAVALDPNNPNVFWVAGQYTPEDTNILWSTFIGHFNVTQ